MFGSLLKKNIQKTSRMCVTIHDSTIIYSEKAFLCGKHGIFHILVIVLMTHIFVPIILYFETTTNYKISYLTAIFPILLVWKWFSGNQTFKKHNRIWTTAYIEFPSKHTEWHAVAIHGYPILPLPFENQTFLPIFLCSLFCYFCSNYVSFFMFDLPWLSTDCWGMKLSLSQPFICLIFVFPVAKL